MSPNQNLPRQAGLKITTIGGKRCTAVPRANKQPAPSNVPSQPPSPARLAPEPVRTTAERPNPPPPVPTTPPETEQLAAPSVVIPPPAPTSTSEIPTLVTPPVASTIDATTEEVPTLSPILAPEPTTFSTLPTPEAISEESTRPVFQTVTRPDPTAEPTRAEEGNSGSNNGIGNDNGSSQPEASSTVMASVPTSTRNSSPEISKGELTAQPSNASNMGPIIGGVLGSLSLMAIAIVLLLLCRRRRKRRHEIDSLTSPFSPRTGEKFYEIDSGSLGPTARSARWKQDLAARAENASMGFKLAIAGVGFMKSKGGSERSGSPAVNLDRGNSQFFHDPVPQHSRNNSSVLTSIHSNKSSVKDKFQDWWAQFSEGWRRKKANEMIGPFSTSRDMSEKGGFAAAPTFAQLAASKESGEGSHHRQDSGTSATKTNTTLPQIDIRHDPFADPFPNPFADPEPSNNAAAQYGLPPKAVKSSSDPFADPATAPALSVAKPQTYVQSVRRSRQSINSTNANGAVANRASSYRPPSGTSRYPSTIAPSIANESDRDTIFSYISQVGGRKGKGRSDPFDLERPELWRPAPEPSRGPPLSHQTQNNSNLASNRHKTTSSTNLYPSPLRVNTDQQHNTTPPKHYSSSVASFDSWGDPSPDLGNGSIGSSLRGNASSRGQSGEYDQDATVLGEVSFNHTGDGGAKSTGIYASDHIKGSLNEILPSPVENEPKVSMDEPRSMAWQIERRRQLDNASPVSAMSVEGVAAVRKSG